MEIPFCGKFKLSFIVNDTFLRAAFKFVDDAALSSGNRTFCLKRILARVQLRDGDENSTLYVYRWLPQINAKFHRESSPLARIGCEITKSAGTRWITFAKNPSPDPIPRINPERKGSFTDHGKKKDDGSSKDLNPPKWQPTRKFSPAKNERGHLQRQGIRRRFNLSPSSEFPYLFVTIIMKFLRGTRLTLKIK